MYRLTWIVGFSTVLVVCGKQVTKDLNNNVDIDYLVNDTELLRAFVVFRHGDRTPDQEELDLFPGAEEQTDLKGKDIFFPYGKKALTNKGKQRAFLVGDWLRRRYSNPGGSRGQLVSRLYLNDEISIRSTDYARTKMTVLAALAALYPPPPPQRWNPALDWQPIPYDYLPYNDDDLLYWYNCPRYLFMRNQVYLLPAYKDKEEKYHSLFSWLTEKTGRNITTTEDVFYLDNLFQTLSNVGVKAPLWAKEVMPEINDVTKLEYSAELYNDDLIRLAAGVQMHHITLSFNSTINSDEDQPKLTLYSAHENNVAALMAAARVFKPHQPKYGSTFSLELRRQRSTGKYGIVAVYAAEAGGDEEVLLVAGCGNQAFCDYDTFLNLTRDVTWTYGEFREQCSKTN